MLSTRSRRWSLGAPQDLKTEARLSGGRWQDRPWRVARYSKPAAGDMRQAGIRQAGAGHWGRVHWHTGGCTRPLGRVHWHTTGWPLLDYPSSVPFEYPFSVPLYQCRSSSVSLRPHEAEVVKGMAEFQRHESTAGSSATRGGSFQQKG